MGDPTVLLVVPGGTVTVEPLLAAIAAVHPEWPCTAVWCGDPQRRPVLDTGRADVTWLDDGLGAHDAAGRSWEHVLVGRAAPVAEWVRALAAVKVLVARGADRVVVMWAGSVAVLGRLDALVAPLADPAAPAQCVLVRRTPAGVVDGDVLHRCVVACSTGSVATGGALAELDVRLDSAWGDDDDVTARLAAVALRTDVAICDDDRIGVGEGRWPAVDPALVVLEHFDPQRPFVLDHTRSDRPSIDVVGRHDVAAALTRASSQLTGRRQPLQLPGGLTVDAAVRAVVADEMVATGGGAALVDRAGRTGQRADTAVPRPWSQAAAFRSWLADRYWPVLHARRRDLAAAFPDPFGADAGAFRAWAAAAWTADDIAVSIPPPERTATEWAVEQPLRSDGVDLVGYVTRESSLGDVARRIDRAIAAAGVPRSLLAYERTASPLVPEPPVVGHRLAHRAAIAVVNADQFPALLADHPELFRGADRRVVGYWFWELADVPPAMRRAFAFVDEIWAGSRFVTDAFAAVAPVPVRHVPIPVPEPVASDRQRASFPPLADVGDREVFGVVLDHFSVTERKNPLAAIDAFRRAFAPDEGPVLVVKTINGSRRWPQHAELLAAAADRRDIVVWDEHLSRADHMAFIRSLDVLVSLHRSEGLGLHLAEAMWLGVPVVATAYSGNLDLMDTTCAELVDARLVPVDAQRAEGVYPASAHWAEPDVDVAAAAMRRLVEDPARRAAIVGAALRRMASQPTLADTGRTIAGLVADLVGRAPRPGR